MSKIPVTIIAGFLGSGKTTLLNQLLSSEHGLKIAVLVNDFGEINIDSQLITNIEGETISFSNGCICCAIRDDLAKAVSELCDSGENYEYIVTETSGVSEPAAVALGLVMPPALSAKIQIDAIITVVDAEQILELDGESKHLAIDQIETADIVVINKTDLVSPERIEAVRDWVREHSAQARLIEAAHGNVPLSILINTSAHDGLISNEHDSHDHANTFFSWHVSEDEGLAFEAIYQFFKSLPQSVYRAKGFLNLNEVPDKQVIVQMVGKRVTLTKGEIWGTQEKRSDIVLIANKEEFDETAITQDFYSCVRSESSGVTNRLAEAVIQILRN